MDERLIVRELIDGLSFDGMRIKVQISM